MTLEQKIFNLLKYLSTFRYGYVKESMTPNEFVTTLNINAVNRQKTTINFNTKKISCENLDYDPFLNHENRNQLELTWNDFITDATFNSLLAIVKDEVFYKIRDEEIERIKPMIACRTKFKVNSIISGEFNG